LRNAIITEADIVAFAKKFNAHLAIIMRKLQYEKWIPYSLGRKFFEPIKLK
jgi:HTH-type transcriptional regulator / antitoxin HigA